MLSVDKVAAPIAPVNSTYLLTGHPSFVTVYVPVWLTLINEEVSPVDHILGNENPEPRVTLAGGSAQTSPARVIGGGERKPPAASSAFIRSLRVESKPMIVFTIL